MADPFKLSRKVNASVTCNLHTMEHYKLPLTKQRNATLGHPKQWQPCVSPNIDASIAKQQAAKTREHTPFSNSAAYQYGKLPMRVQDSVMLESTNPIRPEVKQLYRSARRYPNEYNTRDVERKLTLNETAARLPSTLLEFTGTKADIERLNMSGTTMDSTFSYPHASTWRLPRKPEGMQPKHRRHQIKRTINLSPRHQVESISHLPQHHLKRISNTASLYNESSLYSTSALNERKHETSIERDRIIRNNMKVPTHHIHTTNQSGLCGKNLLMASKVTDKNLLVMPNPVSLGKKVRAGKVFRVKIKLRNISNKAIRPLCKISHTNNLYSIVAKQPHTLAPGDTKFAVLEIASPFEGNCDCVMNITDRRNDENETGMQVVIFGSSVSGGEHLAKKEINSDKRSLHMEVADPTSTFRRHINCT